MEVNRFRRVSRVFNLERLKTNRRPNQMKEQDG